MKKIILSVFAVFLSAGMFAQVQNYAIGDIVDDFTVIDVEGNEWNLYDLTSQGKYVYLDFFYDTCGPCQVTIPIYNEFHDKYGCNEGELFMISINNGSDSDAEVIAFEEEHGGEFNHCPAVSVDGGADAVDANLGITAYPTYCMIGPDNKLVENDIWPIDDVTTFEATIPDASSAAPMACSLGTNDVVGVDFSIYPNPSTGNKVNISLSENTNEAAVTIYNMLGSVVYTNTFTQATFTVDADLATGSYVISIKTDAGTLNKSLVVK